MYASRRRFLDIELATAKIALHDPVLGAVWHLTPSMAQARQAAFHPTPDESDLTAHQPAL
jgi:hypothetical protein